MRSTVRFGRSAGIGDPAGLEVQLPLRCCNFIEQSRANHQIVAEEMLLWSWCGTPQQKEFHDHAKSNALLAECNQHTAYAKTFSSQTDSFSITSMNLAAEKPSG